MKKVFDKTKYLGYEITAFKMVTEIQNMNHEADAEGSKVVTILVKADHRGLLLQGIGEIYET